MRRADFNRLMDKARQAGAQIAAYELNRPTVQDFIAYNAAGEPLIAARVFLPRFTETPIVLYLGKDAETITDNPEQALTMPRLWRHKPEDIKQAQSLTHSLIEFLENSLQGDTNAQR